MFRIRSRNKKPGATCAATRVWCVGVVGGFKPGRTPPVLPRASPASRANSGLAHIPQTLCRRQAAPMHRRWASVGIRAHPSLARYRPRTKIAASVFASHPHIAARSSRQTAGPSGTTKQQPSQRGEDRRIGGTAIRSTFPACTWRGSTVRGSAQRVPVGAVGSRGRVKRWRHCHLALERAHRSLAAKSSAAGD
jgi:hypothetical protein